MAFHLDGLSVRDHLVHFLLSDAVQGLRHPFPAAVAGKFHRHRGKDLHIHSFQKDAEDLLRAVSILQKLRHGMDAAQIRFQLLNDRFFREGHELDDEAARLLHGIVLFHQDAKPDGGGHLLRRREVPGQILRDLSRLQVGLAHIGLLQPQVADHLQRARSDGAAHVQLALAVGGKDHLRMHRIALHSALAVRSHRQAARRAVSPDLQGEDVRIPLHHAPHHRSGAQKTSKRRRHHRAGIVRRARRLHCVSCRYRKRAHLRVRGRRSHQIIAHFPCSLAIQ